MLLLRGDNYRTRSVVTIQLLSALPAALIRPMSVSSTSTPYNFAVSMVAVCCEKVTSASTPSISKMTAFLLAEAAWAVSLKCSAPMDFKVRITRSVSSGFPVEIRMYPRLFCIETGEHPSINAVHPVSSCSGAGPSLFFLLFPRPTLRGHPAKETAFKERVRACVSRCYNFHFLGDNALHVLRFVVALEHYGRQDDVILVFRIALHPLVNVVSTFLAVRLPFRSPFSSCFLGNDIRMR